MDRRTALKNLTKSIGYTVAAPTIMNILASCSSDKTALWTPLFLTSDEKHMVTHLVDLILPKTEIPGGLDVNIPQFLDAMYHNIELQPNQELFKKGAEYFSKIFTQTLNKPVSSGTKEDFNVLLDKYLNLSKEDSKYILKQQKLNVNAISEKETETYSIYKFLLSVRYYSIFGYCTSEKVGKEILAYDPVPGVYNGCISLEETTNGRAWSL
ncbi:gluconate 2-dehydrogenase subunit 3 family protein [Tamlana sp. 2201CG12-4]|uniref:gluconate 2-dehydrogenase subunit 3 family protein n=1 Tax=Tamlana sp. 2201CG12-4 TaxID=3112582 RepID=UPI002DB5C5CB|nr:gluconate 2-dehydrogenase subunit 3 family protein [Tamlana sp. 2201CG12-4]MEC3905661.1 gluconate 2-dehydrogenase subunit 3 family protein [Tamlana sp. 2201CG12-4]